MYLLGQLVAGGLDGLDSGGLGDVGGHLGRDHLGYHLGHLGAGDSSGLLGLGVDRVGYGRVGLFHTGLACQG